MHDVIILGAGAAGLAAASALRNEDADFLVLEARDRTGGRCFSMQHDASPIPLELGAEFIHGDVPETERLAARAGVPLCDVAGEHWHLRGSRLTRQSDFWDRVGRVLALLPDSGPDISFGEFLARSPGGSSAAHDRRLARGFVQGFHAADIDRISAQSLADAGNPRDDESAARHGRTVGGYTALLAPLAHTVTDRIRFGAVVRAVRWRRGHAVVETSAGTWEARRIICTLPVGVLQGGDVTFDPVPKQLRIALDGIAMGDVARVTLVFDRRFWEEVAPDRLPSGASLTDMSFLHTPQAPFNVWWTMFPLRAPVIVAWSGGPPAAQLLAEGDVEACALNELANALGMTRRRLTARLVAAFHHDWSSDPFSRGAYSYTTVGGANAAKQLARPVQGTLYFAGEATADGDNGTVEGAITSGMRAARQCMR